MIWWQIFIITALIVITLIVLICGCSVIYASCLQAIVWRQSMRSNYAGKEIEHIYFLYFHMTKISNVKISFNNFSEIYSPPNNPNPRPLLVVDVETGEG